MVFLKLKHAIGLKRRYLYTRNGKMRLRVATVPLAAMMLSAFVVSGKDTNLKPAIESSPLFSQAALTTNIETQPLENIHPDVDVLLNQHITAKALPEEAPLASRILKAVYTPPAKPDIRRFTLESGDSMSVLLDRASVDPSQAHQVIQSLSKELDLRDLRAGQKIDIEYVRDDAGQPLLQKMSLPISQLEKITLSRTPEGYETRKETKSFKHYKKAVVAEINEDTSSLYLALSSQGVPHDIIADTIRAYSWDIDFQRDIWRGNTINILYNKAIDEDGNAVTGKSELIFAHLTTNHKDLPIFRFHEKGQPWADYYHQDGRSVRMLLLSTPVDGARLSSGFGKRKHPILGYTKMHKGADFAAPTGTPVYAAGDGVVERASRFSSYGHYIRIRHKGSLKTAYAHLHGYGKGIKAGAKVKQGQVIGYVGSTGRSTGPHLHYEVIQNGRHVNPRSLKLPTGDKLKGTELARFKQEAADITRIYEAALKRQTRIAARSSQ